MSFSVPRTTFCVERTVPSASCLVVTSKSSYSKSPLMFKADAASRTKFTNAFAASFPW